MACHAWIASEARWITGVIGSYSWDGKETTVIEDVTGIRWGPFTWDKLIPKIL